MREEETGTPHSVAKTEVATSSGASDDGILVDENVIATALEEDMDAVAEEEAEDDDVEVADDEWAAEEKKLREENKKRMEEQKRKSSKMSTAERVKMLDNLLQKAAAYTAFLRGRMKEVTDVKEHADKVHAEHEAEAKSPKKSPGKDKAKKDGVEKDSRQPALLTGGVMRSYQIEGMVWMTALYENGLNGILADEMGLGKTLQTIAFLAHLQSNGVNGPFLVVAPLSTITNWQREFTKFAPKMQTLLYHGSKEDRLRMRVENGFEKKQKPGKKYPVVITSFEVAMNDVKKLANLRWKYIVVDEGHRLKNKDCRLLRELKTLMADNRLLLSGTPLQNNLSELWSLLNFILPDIFQDLNTFKDWFAFDEDLHHEDGAQRVIEEERDNKTISKLHTILDPFLLRRLKSDVLAGMLPRKREYLLFAPLTETQQKYNEAIGNRTLAALVEKEASGGYKQDDAGGWSKNGAVNKNATSLQNILMQMRKNCNHPYLFQAPLDPMGNVVIDERIVKSGGKLQLLDRMLKVLRKAGNKVLVFCQMTKMMDLIEDYLELREYPVARIDGTVPWKERQELMDSYNSDKSAFVFLLSTRAGGLGINLVSADTVIIFDSDFNPQQDLQAQDRCHRIGQTKPVSVFRFLTIASVETKILERANNKRKLELVAIARKRFKVSDKLEHGADIAALQSAGQAESSEEKRQRVANLTQVRESLTADEMHALLSPKRLEEVNKDIISDKDLERLLLKRGDNEVPDDGRGWQLVESHT